MTKPGAFKLSDSRSGWRGMIAMLVLLLVLSAQTGVFAAAAPEPPARENRITVFNIVMFYAGVFGVLVGAATGWVTLLTLPGGGETIPPLPDEAPKPAPPMETR